MKSKQGLVALGVGVLLLGACASSRDPVGQGAVDGALEVDAAPASDDAGAGVDAAPPALDAALADAAALDAAPPDAAPPDAAPPDAMADAMADATVDTTAPGAVINLTATATGFDSVRLDWTAPGDDGATGTATAYDVRFALATISSDPLFAAAASAGTPPAPALAGTAQSMTISGLGPNTTYHFALRARDEVPNTGPRSNSASATTFSRATLLITEVAPSNGAVDNFDFIELTATQGGRTDGLSVTDASGTVHMLAPFSIATGERIVIHTTGLPCPTGCVQEDLGGNPAASTAAGASAAWDVYTSSTGLIATDNVISLREGTTIRDAVALANRDGDASAAAMTAFAELRSAGAWSFSAAPVDMGNDCTIQREAVSVATTDTSCGGFAVAGAGRSLQRNGTSDTGGKADFFVGPQTPGAASAGNAAPTVVSATPRTATTVRVRFDDELAAAGVVPGSFSITGLAVSAATLADVHEVDLTVSPAQTPGMPYVVNVSAITDLQGTALGSPASARFCGFSPVPPGVVINELSPAQVGGSDLVELRVTAGGPLLGVTLRMNPDATGGTTLLGTLPAICAATGDLVVVHLIPPAGTAMSSETTSVTQFPVATYAANYDGAYDVLGSTSTGISATETVLLLRDSAGAILDAAAFSNQSASASPALFLTALTYIQGAGAWLPPNCGGAPCTDTTTPTAKGVAASYMGVGSTPTGMSCRRTADTNLRADWSVAAQTLGAAN